MLPKAFPTEIDLTEKKFSVIFRAVHLRLKFRCLIFTRVKANQAFVNGTVLYLIISVSQLIAFLPIGY